MGWPARSPGFVSQALCPGGSRVDHMVSGRHDFSRTTEAGREWCWAVRQLWDSVMVLHSLLASGGFWEPRTALGQASVVEKGPLRLEGFPQRG